ADAAGPLAGGGRGGRIPPHHPEDPPEPVLGLRLQRARNPAGGRGAPGPGDRRCRDGVLLGERGGQHPAAAALATVVGEGLGPAARGQGGGGPRCPMTAERVPARTASTTSARQRRFPASAPG